MMGIDVIVVECMSTISRTFDSLVAEKEKNRLKRKELKGENKSPPTEKIEIEAPPW